MFEVSVSCRDLDAFIDLVGVDRVRSVKALAGIVRGHLGRSRAIWNINSTATGGGVAEMLRSLLRYARGLGVQTRWLVIEGPPEFFRITKRIHNALHDSMGDGSPLGARERRVYEQVMRDNIVALDALVQPGDIVICHDPQSAGLVPHLLARRARVVWRCHIGHDRHTEEVDRGWQFLREYLDRVPLAVFSREDYAPEWLPRKRCVVLPPNIDPFSAKNQELAEGSVRAILGSAGLIDDPGGGAPTFVRDDGSSGRVDRKAEVLRLGRAPSYDTPLVVQVSRWDGIKDPVGVLHGFAETVRADAADGAQLVLAGPSVSGVIDDLDGAPGLERLVSAWRSLPDSVRQNVHLAQLPMIDNEENAAMVNALQRHATVIVQKSLHEGFGLTVTEAMWKRRPVVASAVGGIRDQIRDGVEGLLVHDPTDASELSRLLASLLADPARARRLGEAGYERVREHYLSITALESWAELIQSVSEATEPAPGVDRSVSSAQTSGLAATLSSLDAGLLLRLASAGFEPAQLLRLAAPLRAGDTAPQRRMHNHVTGKVEAPRPDDIVTIPALASAKWNAVRVRGEEALRRGEVAFCAMAGGMATRMGGVVKALAEVTEGHTFLDMRLAENRTASARAGKPIPLWLMTSEATHQSIETALAEAHAPAHVAAFKQNLSLRLKPDGSLFRGDDGQPCAYPTGHGDLVDALRRSKLLDVFVERGGKYVWIANIDNLGASIDPVVLGEFISAVEDGVEVQCEVCRKEGDRGGIPVRVDGRLQVLEEFRLTANFDASTVNVFNTNTFLVSAEPLLRRQLEWTYFEVEKTVDGTTAIQFERLLQEIAAQMPSRCLEVPRDGGASRFIPVKDFDELARRRPTIDAVAKARGML